MRLTAVSRAPGLTETHALIVTCSGKSQDMPPSPPFLCSCRLAVAFLCFLLVTNMVYLRLNMSVAIVCMVNQSQSAPSHGSSNSTFSGNSNTFSTDSNSSGVVHVLEDGPLQWDAIVQGQVLVAYFYGYAASKIPTGWAVRRVGGKNLVLASSLASSIMCLVIPIVALQSSTAIILMRVVMGLCGGMISPAVHGVLSNWSPPSERSRMVTYTFAGFPCGVLAAFILSGLLCESDFLGGWPSIFYVFGTSSLVFSLLWAVLVTESPESHRCVSKCEKDYIQASLAENTSSYFKADSVPWRSILTSPAVYAVVVCGISTDFFNNVFLLYLPTYMVQVMTFDIASSGLHSALPYVFCFLAITFSGQLSDWLIQKTKLTTGVVRKLVTGSGMLLCIVSLVWLSFLGSDQASVAVSLLVISMIGLGLMTIGYYVNPLDIAPKYSSVIVGIACLGGDISGFVSPAIVSGITAQGTPRESFQIVFLLSAGVAGLCLIFYVCFASGEVQPWAQTPQEATFQDDVAYKGDTSSTKQSEVTDCEQDSTARLLHGTTSI